MYVHTHTHTSCSVDTCTAMQADETLYRTLCIASMAIFIALENCSPLLLPVSAILSSRPFLSSPRRISSNVN